MVKYIVASFFGASLFVAGLTFGMYISSRQIQPQYQYAQPAFQVSPQSATAENYTVAERQPETGSVPTATAEESSANTASAPVLANRRTGRICIILSSKIPSEITLFKNMLREKGHSVEIVSWNDVPEPVDRSKYDLFILYPQRLSWREASGQPPDLTKIFGDAKVIVIGAANMYFNKSRLPICSYMSKVSYGDASASIRSVKNILSAPYNVNIPDDMEVKITESQSPSVYKIHPFPGLERIVSPILMSLYDAHFTACRAGNYIFWGYPTPEGDVSNFGRRLFIDICGWFMAIKTAPVTLPEKKSVTDLFNAAASNDVAAVKRLIAEKADVNAPDYSGEHLLLWLLTFCNPSDELISVLVDAGADLNTYRKETYLTPLFQVVAARRNDLVDKFLAKGAKASPNALLLALRRGDTALAEKLLKAGADPYAVMTQFGPASNSTVYSEMKKAGRMDYLTILEKHAGKVPDRLLKDPASWKPEENGWFLDFEKAKAEASAKKKKLLLLFTGSDWCGYCIRLKKDVLMGDKFKKIVENDIVPVYVDFPSRTIISAEQREHNKNLREKYAGNSGYPHTIVLEADGKVLGRIGGFSGADRYLKRINDLAGKTPDPAKTDGVPAKTSD